MVQLLTCILCMHRLIRRTTSRSPCLSIQTAKISSKHKIKHTPRKTMMASASASSQGDNKVGTTTKENFDPREQRSEREKFLIETGECQAILEELVEKDEVLSLEKLDKMESAMCPFLLQGFFLMKQRQLTSQEYYQACMAILLARLFEHGGKPSSIIASLRNCLSADKSSSKNGAATTSHGYASLFSLIMDRSQEHPGLNMEEWAHIMGLVSTIQSNVYVVSKRRQLKRQRKDIRLCRSLASSMTNRISDDSLDAMWVIPLSYVVGYVVYDSCCTQQQQDGKTLFWSWKRDIRPKIETILFTAFPRLRPTDYVDAGLMILQLDLLQNDNKRMSEVVNTASVVEDLLQDNLLKPMVAATDLPKYALLARCSQVFLSRLDTDDTDEVVQACSQLLCKQNPLAYINQLENRETPIQKNKTDVLVVPVLENSSYEADAAVKEGNLTHRDRLLSPAYPLLTQIDALLVNDNVDQAINIVVKMEACTILCEDEKIQGWCKIFHYLFQTGQIFLDGKVHRQEYMVIRKIILEKIVTRAGPLGMSVFLDSYENLLEQIAENKEITNEEQTYIRRACHQTVLRILQAKHNEEHGMDVFQKTYWKNIEKLKAPAGASGLMWSSLSLSSSREEQLNWACRLLTEANPVPESMQPADSPFPDLMSLLHRGEPQPMMLEAEPSPNVNEVPISEKYVGTTLPTAGEKPTEDNEVEKFPNNATITEASVLMKDQIAQDSDEKGSVVEIVDISYDEDGEGAQGIVRQEESAAEETADEESVNELFTDQEEEESSENEGEDQQAVSKEAEVMVEMDDDEHAGYHEDGSYSTDDVSEQKEEIVEAACGHSAVEAGYEVGSQTGYEPEGTEGEVSEAVHTEDEEEERRELQMNRGIDMSQDEEMKELPKHPVKPLQYTLSDMDYADEQTTEHEEDLGAESSELDEREGTGVAPQSLVSTHGNTGEAPTLMDYAVRAQQAESRSSHSHQVDTARSPGEPWHWGSSTPQQEELLELPPQGTPGAYSIANDTNAAQAGNSAVSFLGSTSYYEASAEEKGELSGEHQVMLDNVPEVLQETGPSETYYDSIKQEQQETSLQGRSRTLAEGHETHPLPRKANESLSGHVEKDSIEDGSIPSSKSTVEALPSEQHKEKSIWASSYAGTNAAHAGSLSFTNSPDYPPTEDEGNDMESPQKKVIVDPLPEMLEDSKEKSSQQAMEIADAKSAGKRPDDAPGEIPVYPEEDHEVEKTTARVHAASDAAEADQYAQAGIHGVENESEMPIAGHRGKTKAEDNDGIDGELQEELTMAQLAESGGMTSPRADKGKASNSALSRRSPKDSNSTLQGKSIDVPSQLTSPGMSSVAATSVEDSPIKSPPSMPFLRGRSRETSREQEAGTKAASETGRRSKRASKMPSSTKNATSSPTKARTPSSKKSLGKRATAADADKESPRRRKAAKKAVRDVDVEDYTSAVQLEQSTMPATRRRGRPRKAGPLDKSPRTDRGLSRKSKDATGKPKPTRRGPGRPRKSKKGEFARESGSDDGKTSGTRSTRRSTRQTRKSEADDGTAGTRSTRRSTKAEADDGTTGTRSTRRSTKAEADDGTRSTRRSTKAEADDGTTGTRSTRRSTRQASKRAGQQPKEAESVNQGKDDEGLSIASRRKIRRPTKRVSGDDDEETKTQMRSTRKRANSVSEEENETESAQEEPTRATRSRAAPEKKRKTEAAAAVESDLPVIPENNEIDAPASLAETRRSDRTKKPKEKEEIVLEEEDSSSKTTKATRGKGTKSSGASGGTAASKNTEGRRKKAAARENEENESVAESATSSVRRSSRRNKGQREQSIFE